MNKDIYEYLHLTHLVLTMFSMGMAVTLGVVSRNPEYLIIAFGLGILNVLLNLVLEDQNNGI